MCWSASPWERINQEQTENWQLPDKDKSVAMGQDAIWSLLL